MNTKKYKVDFCAQVLEEINSVRKDPQTYASKLRKYAKYFKGEILRFPEHPPIMSQEGAKAYLECSDFLDEIDPLPVLKFHQSLTRIAEDIACDIQKIGKIEEMDNINPEVLISKYGEVVGHFAEAVDFGSSFSELVALNLLVDDGDPVRGNRSNLLNPNFKLVGIASVSHKEFLNVTVICYARHFFNYGEKIGELSDDNYEKEDKLEKKKEEPKVNVKKINNDNTPDQVKQTENKEVNENLNKKVENNHNDEDDDDMDLPEGVAKIERHEKIVTEGNIQKKIIKIKKFKEDGTIEVEIKKENLN